MKKYLILNFLIFLITTYPAYAETAPPRPPNKELSLDNYEKRLSEEAAQQKALSEKMQSIEQEMDTTREKMVEIGNSVRKSEKNLQSIDQRIEILENEKIALETNLSEQRKAIAGLVLALERIRRVPPQALIAKPDAPLKTAQSVMLLGDIIPAINTRTLALKENLVRQAELTKELELQKQEAQSRANALKQEYNALASLTEERETLFKQTRQDYEDQEAQVRRVSQGAKNLKDLVKKLEEKKKQEQLERERARKKAEAQQVAALTQPDLSIPPTGSARLPISGVVKTRYNDLDKFGAKSQGIRIEGMNGGLVVAPMGGSVRFAGPFKGYDTMVIIEHENGYHSLVAGLEKVNVSVGQNVSAGEPLGLLKNATNNGKPTVYYELRLNGNAVDPAQKLTDLG